MSYSETKYVVANLNDEQKKSSSDLFIVLSLISLFIILFLPVGMLFYNTSETFGKSNIRDSCERIFFHEIFNEIKVTRVLLAILMIVVFFITLKFIVLFMLLHVLIEKWDLRPTVLVLMLLITVEIFSFVLVLSVSF